MRFRSAAGVALAAAVGLALVACNKKEPVLPDGPPPNFPKAPGTGANQPGGPGNAQAPSDPAAPRVPVFTKDDLRLRTESQNKLKQLAIGMHNFEATYGAFPAAIADKGGKQGLSWRVAVLPYIEQENLYKQFKLDEPWDSEHNKKLIPLMPKVLAAPGTQADAGYTFYRGFTGANALLNPVGRPAAAGQPVLAGRLVGVPDGTANTFMIVEGYDPVVWTKPDELVFNPSQLPKLGGVFGTGFNAAMVDASARFVRNTVAPQEIAKAIQVNDGNVVNLDN